MDPYNRLIELGLELPAPPEPVGAYVPWRLHKGLLFVSGQLPLVDGELLFTGVLGRELEADQGYAAARQCALNCLGIMHAALGRELSRIDQVLRLTGLVACADDFYGQPAVVNGASELLAAVLGESGRHSRVATGVNSLPLNAPVMVDLVAAVSQEY